MGVLWQWYVSPRVGGSIQLFQECCSTRTSTGYSLGLERIVDLKLMVELDGGRWVCLWHVRGGPAVLPLPLTKAKRDWFTREHVLQTTSAPSCILAMLDPVLLRPTYE